MAITSGTDAPSSEANMLLHAICDAADHAGLAIAVLRPGPSGALSDLLYANGAAERMFGFPQAELRARGIEALLPRAEEPLRRALELPLQTAPRNLLTTLARKDGTPVAVDIALGQVGWNGGPGRVLFLRDGSARRAAEAALQRSAALFAEVVQDAPDGIYIVRWPRVLFANPAGARILEFQRAEQVIGLDLSARMPPSERARAAEWIERAQRGIREPEPRQFRGRNPSGRAFAVEVSALPIEFEGGPAALVFARDVTEQNTVLVRLREAEKLAAVNALAAGVCHEINNPLAYVLLNLEFLERELPELGANPARIEALQRRLADTRHGAERVKHIVRDLQALTRKDEGIRGPVELDQIIEYALQLAKRELARRIVVTTQFERVPCVLGNPTRLEQLFFNLILNAAHALHDIDQAERRIHIALRRSDGAGELPGATHVLAQVEDNGCGMSDQVLSRAFEPFFTTKALGVGAGLGLAICKRIVDDLGGQIIIQSRPLAGTTVRVYLPHCEQLPDAADGHAARRGRLLVVDDERAVTESLRHALKDEHDVDTAGSAREARTLLEVRRDYDVVLCDLTMPVESGAELYTYVRGAYPELAERFVFMTGGAFTPRAINFLQESKRPHVEKPFELERLRSLLASCIEARES